MTGAWAAKARGDEFEPAGIEWTGRAADTTAPAPVDVAPDVSADVCDDAKTRRAIREPTAVEAATTPITMLLTVSGESGLERPVAKEPSNTQRNQTHNAMKNVPFIPFAFRQCLVADFKIKISHRPFSFVN